MAVKSVIPLYALRDPKVIVTYKDQILQAIFDTPENPDLYNALALCYLAEGNHEEAIRLAKQAIGFDPKSVGAYIPLSGIYDSIGWRDVSAAILEHARSISDSCPAVNWNYALYRLYKGDFELGLDLYRWRKVHLGQIGMLRTLQPEWDKTQKGAGGRLLIWAEQGLGDYLMAFRFVKQIKEKFKFNQVYLEVPEELYTLVCRHDEGIDRIFIRSKDLTLPCEFDYHCSIMDLPYNLGIKSYDDWNGSAPYLIPNEAVKVNWEKNYQENKFEKPPIGITWSGSSGHPNNHNRSAKIADFAPLQEFGTLLSAQKFTNDGEEDVVPEGMNLLSAEAGLVNADYTSGFYASLRCVVTVDTFTAHLAGALGVETYLILPKVSEWRWGSGEGLSYLYPNVRMFKQKEAGDWSHPIKEVCKCLTQHGRR